MDYKPLKIFAASLIALTIIAVVVGVGNIYRLAHGNLLSPTYGKIYTYLETITVVRMYLITAAATLILQAITVRQMTNGKTKLSWLILVINLVILFSLLSAVWYDMEMATSKEGAIYSYLIPGMCSAGTLMLCIWYYERNSASARLFISLLVAILWVVLYLLYDSYQYHGFS